MRQLLTVIAPPALILALLLPFAPFEGVEGTVKEARGGFETGDFSEFSDLQAKRGGRLEVTKERAYEGTHAGRARWLGGTTGAQRVWRNVDWRNGTEVWYGVAVFVPRRTSYCYWNPIRWDNYDLYGGTDDNMRGTGDLGGVTVQGGRVWIMRNTYGGKEELLLKGGRLARERWVWLEVHQVLSDDDGEALSEVYLDGRKQGSTRKANSFGRRITDLRVGAVAIADECSSPGEIDFDRFTISNRRLGPLAPRDRAHG